MRKKIRSISFIRNEIYFEYQNKHNQYLYKNYGYKTHIIFPSYTDINAKRF